MAIDANIKKNLKGQGILCNRDGEHFNVRVLTGCGVVNAETMAKVSDMAARFGNGKVGLTSRMTFEIMGVPFENVEPLKAALADAGLESGGTGPRVRPVVACKGTVCVFGLIDTQKLGMEIHERFYKGWHHVKLPHKFKIAVGGCPNNCVKPDLNDLGIIGQKVMEIDEKACRGCAKCAMETACPVKAITRNAGGKMVIDRSVCVNCGRCAEKCPFKAGKVAESGYRIYVGGRWGKKTRMGTPLKDIYTHDEALDMVEKAILLFKRDGQEGERFGNLVDRLGVDRVEAILACDELTCQKEEILARE